MDIDTNRIRELLNKRDEIDAELRDIFAGTKKPQKCSKCGADGHNARACKAPMVE